MCGNTYTTKQILKRHMRCHTESKPFKCFYCDYRTNRKESLKTHCIRKHEMEEDEYKRKANELYPKVKEHFIDD